MVWEGEAPAEPRGGERNGLGGRDSRRAGLRRTGQSPVPLELSHYFR